MSGRIGRTNKKGNDNFKPHELFGDQGKPYKDVKNTGNTKTIHK